MDTKLNRQTHVLLTWDLDDGISRLVWNGNLAKIIFIVNRKVIFARGFLIFPIQPDSATVISTAAAAAASTVVVAALEEEEEGACMVDCCLLFSLLIIN